MRRHFALIWGPWLMPCVLAKITIEDSTTESTVYYAPNPGHEVYWIGGHWVFGSTAGVGTTRAANTLHTAIQAKDQVRVCGEPCARIYRTIYGKVCAHPVDNVYQADYSGGNTWDKKTNKIVDWRLGGELDRNYDYMRTFNSYCEFKDAQCRTKVFHGMGLVFLHMGSCLTDNEVFHPLVYGRDRITYKQDRVADYYRQFDNYEDKRGKNEKRCETWNNVGAWRDFFRNEWLDRIKETGSCYMLGWYTRNFYNARSYCAWRGGHLVIIENENERRVVKDIIQESPSWGYTKQVFWAGYHCDYTTRIWYTVQNEPLSEINFAPWSPGEPNNDNGYEDCVYIDVTARFTDTPCNNWFYFICEIEVTSELVKYT